MQNEATTEFFKLHTVDKKTLFWLMDHKREEIKAWVEFVTWEYNKRKKIELDADKLYKEINAEFEES